MNSMKNRERFKLPVKLIFVLPVPTACLVYLHFLFSHFHAFDGGFRAQVVCIDMVFWSAEELRVFVSRPLPPPPNKWGHFGIGLCHWLFLMISILKSISWEKHQKISVDRKWWLHSTDGPRLHCQPLLLFPCRFCFPWKLLNLNLNCHRTA